ncbi:MAG: Hint domain-containing protein [Roseovarius sp.]
MATSDISVIPYSGSLLAADLLAGSTTLVLSNFGSQQTGTLEDNDGLLEDADDGTSTFNGAPINYIGSGSATGGIEVAGIFVGVGPTVDVVVFEAAGQIYFHYPNGQPALSQLLLNVDITAAPYQVFTPVCFAADTLILTPDGERTIQELQAGDEVVDFYGQAHEIIWTGSRRLTLPRGAAFHKWRPVDFDRDALGDGRPYRITRVSQQHRIVLNDWRAQLCSGEDEVFVPAVHLVNGEDIRVNTALDEVEYCHVMCAEHVVLVANGMPAESLFPGSVALEGLERAARTELLEIFPELADGVVPAGYTLARPALKRKQAQMLAMQSSLSRRRSRRAPGALS